MSLISETDRLANDPHELVAQLMRVISDHGIEMKPELVFGAIEYLKSDPLGRAKLPWED